jgi:chromosome segregation ATPase
MKFDVRELDDEVVAYIAKLRQEAARARHQRNGARAEADTLREAVGELTRENATLRAELGR